MIIAALPANEEERLAELARYDILDTPPEDAYDAMTQVASQICATPIALISLIDRDRQWFKSRVGLDLTSTSRNVAFGAHAILEPDSLLIVPDAREDPRFTDNPLVTGHPAIRFYAGAPLVTSLGHALGTLCLIDKTPRSVSSPQMEALKALAVQVMALLEARWAVLELERTRRELEDALQDRQTFIATISHEMRTPLSAVVGYVDLLSDPRYQIPEDERAEMIATIGRQAGNITNIIDDLLVAARARSDSLKIQRVEVDLEAQTAEVLEGLEPGQAGTIRVTATPARAIGDPARVRQVIRNLITNAFRYGGPDIEIGVRSEGDRCRLEVSDDGPGIPEEAEERIFEAFEQVSHGSFVSGSMGLGLSISRLLAEKMEGTLTYKRSGGRTVFCLDLPASPSTDGGSLAWARQSDPLSDSGSTTLTEPAVSH